MRKTRDLIKKVRDTKRTFYTNMGLIKDGNGMDLTEAEDIKRWQEYTEELHTKNLHVTIQSFSIFVCKEYNQSDFGVHGINALFEEMV